MYKMSFEKMLTPEEAAAWRAGVDSADILAWLFAKSAGDQPAWATCEFNPVTRHAADGAETDLSCRQTATQIFTLRWGVPLTLRLCDEHWDALVNTIGLKGWTL